MSCDLTRSQFRCGYCEKTRYDIFAKRDDGHILLCSEPCFNNYREQKEDINKTHKWSLRFVESENVSTISRIYRNKK